MKPAGHRAVQLFTIPERIGIACGLFLFGVSTKFAIQSAAHRSSDLGDVSPGLVVFVFQWFLQFLNEKVSSDLCVFVAFLISVTALVFCNRIPEWIVRWLCFQTAIFAFCLVFSQFLIPGNEWWNPWTPVELTDDVRVSGGFCGYQAGAISFVAATIIMICLTGEFSELVRARRGRQALIEAERLGDEAARRSRRHQQLCAAITRPRMPIASCAGRAIAFIMVTPLAVFCITEMSLKIDSPREATLPAPEWAAVSPGKPIGEGLPVQITADGQFFLHGTLIAESNDRECPRLVEALKLATTESSPQYLELQIEPTVRYERLVDLLNLAAQSHLPVWILD